MIDPRLRDKYWRITHLYQIINKDGKSQRFTLNGEQEELFHAYQNKKKSGVGLRERILKNRQVGFTTFHCIYYLDEVIFNRNRQAAIIAHRREALERIFNIVKYAWQSMPEILRPKARMDNVRELKLEEPNSSIYIELKVRSGTVHHLHVSEVAYITEQKELKTGSFQAVPLNGDITVETTANGINEFHDDWHNPSSLWTNHFFSWLRHKEYVSPTLRTGKYEDYLNKIGADQEQKNWWYAKFEEIGSIDDMRQEYPANAEESFITSGKGIYNDELQNMGILNPIESPDDSYKDYLLLFEHPQDGAQYCLGADPSGGFADGDNACFYIFNSKTHKPAMRWKGRMSPDLFGLEIKKWAEKYNEAFVGIEVNNHGLTTINTIKDDYSNMYKRERRDRVTNEITKELGWITTEVSRREIIDRIRLYLREYNEIPESLLGELRTFVRKDNGKIEAEDGQHDDEVFGFGIALMMLDANPYYEFKKKDRTYFGH